MDIIYNGSELPGCAPSMILMMVDSAETAVAADTKGADVLLCSALAEGGLTPTVEMLQTVKRTVTIPVYCVLRCRPGNFCFSPEEITTMKNDATLLQQNGAAGFVFGAITTRGGVDQEACRQIREALPENTIITFDANCIGDLGLLLEGVNSQGLIKRVLIDTEKIDIKEVKKTIEYGYYKLRIDYRDFSQEDESSFNNSSTSCTTFTKHCS